VPPEDSDAMKLHITNLITKNHTDKGYGKKTMRANASGVLGKLRMMKLSTRQVYFTTAMSVLV
jgi:hypothetical protein